jgi:hypothetical protein
MSKVVFSHLLPVLKNSLEPWFDNLPLATLKKIIFMHDNALSHAAKATTQFLHSLGFVNETLMVWLPNSPDLNYPKETCGQ